MSKGFIAILSILCLAGAAAADHSLVGQSGVPYSAPEIRPEQLYQGDLVPELGIGCSNPTGTSGGPNYVCVGVTATTTPPLYICGHFYNIYTNVSPNITSLTFKVWSGFAAPGVELGGQAGMPWAQGNHTVAISPPIIINDPWFFLGQQQTQANVGIRWGLDQSSSAGTSWIKAPTCGLSGWGTMTSIGYPGNWCMAVTVSDGPSPVELQSWGQIKAQF